MARTVGQPQTVEYPVELPADTTACIEVRSPDASPETATASAWVRLDGREVVRPSELSHHPATVRQTVDLAAGEHSVEVTQRSTPGATLGITVRIAAVDPGVIIEQARTLADLRHRGCTELNRLLESVPPENRSLIVSNISMAGFQPGQLAVEGNLWDVPRLLTPLPSEDLGPAAVTPEERALAWLERYRSVFRLTDPDIVFEAQPAADLEDGAHRVELRARWRGLRLEGVGLTVLLDSDDQVRSVAGEVVPRVVVAPAALVTAGQAVAIAETAVGSPTIAEPELEVLDLALVRQEARTALAWMVQTRAGVVRVDAVSGEILNVAQAPTTRSRRRAVPVTLATRRVDRSSSMSIGSISSSATLWDSAAGAVRATGWTSLRTTRTA